MDGQDLVEPRKTVTVARVEHGDLIRGHVGQGPLLAAEPTRIGVVGQHHDVIGGHPQIGLHPVQPERHDMLDGAPGVLRDLPGSSAMRDHGAVPPGPHRSPSQPGLIVQDQEQSVDSSTAWWSSSHFWGSTVDSSAVSFFVRTSKCM